MDNRDLRFKLIKLLAKETDYRRDNVHDLILDALHLESYIDSTGIYSPKIEKCESVGASSKMFKFQSEKNSEESSNVIPFPNPEKDAAIEKLEGTPVEPWNTEEYIKLYIDFVSSMKAFVHQNYMLDADDYWKEKIAHINSGDFEKDRKEYYEFLTKNRHSLEFDALNSENCSLDPLIYEGLPLTGKSYSHTVFNEQREQRLKEWSSQFPSSINEEDKLKDWTNLVEYPKEEEKPSYFQQWEKEREEKLKQPVDVAPEKEEVSAPKKKKSSKKNKK
jgi:hypothetical protein